MKNPKLITKPFAQNGQKNAIPENYSSSMESNQATWDQGFGQITMIPVAAGGLPPKGQDFNGIFNQISENVIYLSKGGRFKFSADYAAAINGYPKGAILQSDDEKKEYQSLVDNNKVNFNTATQAQINDAWKLFSTDDMLQQLAGKQPAGSYALKGDSYTKVESDTKFQPKGDYQPKGNYLVPGSYGLGGAPEYLPIDKTLTNEFSRGDKNHTNGAFGYWYGITLAWSGAEKTNAKCQIITGINNRDLYYRFAINATNAPLEFGVAMKIYSDGNTTTDKNGFIRASGEATALTTNDVTQTVGSSKTAVMSQFAVNEALGNKQNKGNYLDKDSTSEQLLKAPLYANGEIGAGNPRGTDAVLLLKTIGASEPQFTSKHTNNSTWLTHTLPSSKGRPSLENTASKDTAGYLICGDTGIIIQWGEVKASLTETDYRQFPVPFRQRCFQIISGYASFQDFGGGSAAYANSNKDFIVTSRTKDNALKDGTVRYIAIGY